MPSKPAPKHVNLTANQLRQLSEECKANGQIVMLLATTGIRWSEMTGLQAGDIPDIGNRIKLVRAAKWEAGKVTIGELKTHYGRTISVPNQSMDYLRERKTAYLMSGFSLAPMGPNATTGAPFLVFGAQ